MESGEHGIKHGKANVPFLLPLFKGKFLKASQPQQRENTPWITQHQSVRRLSRLYRNILFFALDPPETHS